MAIMNTNAPRSAFGVSTVFATLSANLQAAWARQSAYTRTFKELECLTDRELEDIGIHRDMIADIAKAEAARY